MRLTHTFDPERSSTEAHVSLTARGRYGRFAPRNAEVDPALPTSRTEALVRILNIIAIVCMTVTVATATWAGPLSDAAKTGDVEEITRLLDAGEDLAASDGLATPLHWAAFNGHAAAVVLLTSRGAKVEAQSNMLGTPLHAAARRGRVDALSALLAAGANPDARDRNQFTALMLAAFDNQTGSVRTLIDAGADVNAIGISPGRQELGEGPTSALHLAIYKGRKEIAAALIEAGAGPIFPENISDFLAVGDPTRGQELAYGQCNECHHIAASDPPHLGTLEAGPTLVGVIGRPVGGMPEYEYSTALKDFDSDWTPELLYAFALRPMLAMPGTAMNVTRGRTPEMVADIVAYFVSVAE
jgi:cytochrome c